MVSADDAKFDALGPGCVSVIYLAFNTDADIANVVTTLKTSSPRYYASVIQNISCIQNDISKGAIFQVTNTGLYPAEFLKGYVLFFKNGKLVDWDYTYFIGDDSEIKPGETISKQITSNESFDSMQIYFDGRYYTR